MKRAGRFVVLCSILALSARAAVADRVGPVRFQFDEAIAGPLTLDVDATEAPRGILHARLSFPVSSGPLTLSYPKWIPGEHGPTGPITDLVGLTLTAAGKPVPWFRDTVDMYAFHCTVPAGARALEARYDYLLPAGGNFSGGISSTANLLVLSWNQVVLYPRFEPSDQVQVTASLRLPEGWRFGTALPVTRTTGASTVFQQVSLTTLVDSPVLAGAFFRSVRLNLGLDPPVFLDMVSDSREALEIKPADVEHLGNLVAEAGQLFGARHYRDYHFLLTLSDRVAHFGLEHHESSDDRVFERLWLEDRLRAFHSNLLAHEYVHSWNGKHRRPAGLATPDYQEPMRDELLWVYEGLTQYLGFVLAARSSVRTPELTHQVLARLAADQDAQVGRRWRPLLDTAVAAQLLYNASDAWSAWRRSTDFYDEGILVWLEVDATIRAQTHGARSLDDFCRRFHGGTSGPPTLRTYTYGDVIATLNEVAPFDWRAFFDRHLEATAPHAPFAGIEACGWKVAWVDTVPSYLKSIEETDKSTDVRHSIGLVLGEDGAITDVVPDSPAARAGIGPGMKLVAVNGRKWNGDLLRAAIKGSRAGGPVELLTENAGFFRSARLDWKGGERYPTLEREAGKPDLLSEILKARR